MTDHSELIERVRAAKGPDRELDRDLCIALAMDMAEDDGTAGWKKAPRLTASIDAALALVERLAPGQWSAILSKAMDMMWAEYAPKMPLEHLPRFILLALLLSLQSQGAA